jgi:ribosome-associated protein YbcJ (S4-like RNA binding protein)
VFLRKEGYEMVRISTSFITLGQLLKMTDWIESGGQAKVAVKSLRISVNNEKEDRRGRKLYPGDVVVIEGKTYTIDQ